MSTWEDIRQDVQNEVDDEDGVFHPNSVVRSYLEHGELFLSLSRFLVEKTVTFPLVANVAEYNMLDTYPDWVWPLRAAITGLPPVTEVKLESVARTRPAWRQTRGTPENYIRLGMTMLAFLPVPNVNMQVVVTYLATPATMLSDPPGGDVPTIQDMWHAPIMDYGVLLATAKEGQLQRTQAILQDIATQAGNKRDVRFLYESRQRKSQSREEAPLTKSDERP